MQFTTTAILSLLAALGSAAPPALEARQGGSFYAVGEHYRGGGCTSGSLIFADPIYTKNACTPLDRFGTEPDIVSYKLTSVSAGCHVNLFLNDQCTGTSFAALVGQCVQGNTPFVSAIVSCPT